MIRDNAYYVGHRFEWVAHANPQHIADTYANHNHNNNNNIIIEGMNILWILITSRAAKKQVIRRHNTVHYDPYSHSNVFLLPSQFMPYYYDPPNSVALHAVNQSLADSNSPFDMAGTRAQTGKIPFPSNSSNFQIPLTRPVIHGPIIHTRREGEQ